MNFISQIDLKKMTTMLPETARDLLLCATGDKRLSKGVCLHTFVHF